jgi:hypothetical protein
MSLAEQALFLLDIAPSSKCRSSLENFGCLEQTIEASLPDKTEEPTRPEATAEPNPFYLASRMNRASYEDQARAEALTQALRQIRASNVAKARGLRPSGRA